MTKYRTMSMRPASASYGQWEEFDSDELEKRFGAAKAAEQVLIHRRNSEAVCQIFRNGGWRDDSQASLPPWQLASELELKSLQAQADALRGMPQLRYEQQAEALVALLEALKRAEDAVREQKARVADAEGAMKAAEGTAKGRDRDVASKRRQLDKRLAAFDSATGPEPEPVAVQ